jgi:streptogramin lyase
MRSAETRAAVALAALSLAIVLGAAALARHNRSSENQPATLVTVASNSLVLIDPDDNRIVASVRLRGQPTRLAYRDGAFWVTAPEAGVVARVDEDTFAVHRFRVGQEPYDVALGDGAAWVPDHDDETLHRVESELGDVRSTDPFRLPAISTGYGFDAVWLVLASGTLLRIDPHTLAVTGSIPSLVVRARTQSRSSRSPTTRSGSRAR